VCRWPSGSVARVSFLLLALCYARLEVVSSRLSIELLLLSRPRGDRPPLLLLRAACSDFQFRVLRGSDSSDRVLFHPGAVHHHAMMSAYTAAKAALVRK
jgi:hypothetical protein